MLKFKVSKQGSMKAESAEQSSESFDNNRAASNSVRGKRNPIMPMDEQGLENCLNSLTPVLENCFHSQTPISWSGSSTQHSASNARSSRNIPNTASSNGLNTQTTRPVFGNNSDTQTSSGSNPQNSTSVVRNNLKIPTSENISRSDINTQSTSPFHANGINTQTSTPIVRNAVSTPISDSSPRVGSHTHLPPSCISSHTQPSTPIIGNMKSDHKKTPAKHVRFPSPAPEDGNDDIMVPRVSSTTDGDLKSAEFVKKAMRNKISFRTSRLAGLVATPIGKKDTNQDRRKSGHIDVSYESTQSASSCSADTWDGKESDFSHSRTSSADNSYSDGGSWSGLSSEMRKSRSSTDRSSSDLNHHPITKKVPKDHSDIIRKTLAKDFREIMAKSRSEELKYKQKVCQYLSAEGRVREYLRSTERHQPFQMSSDTESSLYSDGTSDIVTSSPRDNTSCNSTLDDLEDSILTLVFSKLSTKDLCRASAVSRKWNRLCWTPELWSTIDISGCRKDSNSVMENILRKLSKISPYACLVIQKLKMNACENLSDEVMRLIGRRCPELKHLEAARCPNLTGEGIAEIFSNCPNLSLLNVASCPGIVNVDLSVSNGIAYGENASFLQLRYVDISECLIDDAALDAIARSCSLMEYLFLRRCESITDKGVVSVANYCTRIREFSVSDCHRVSDSGLKFFVKKSHDLRYISIAKCNISDDTVKYIAKYCKKVRYLNLHMCHSVSDEGIARVAQSCEKLRALDIGKCEKISDTSLNFIAANCPQLRRLNIKGCDRITDSGLRKLATHCRTLKHLNVQECDFTFETYLYLRQRCVCCIIEHTKPEFF